jgi:hypothetical protein
MVLADVAAYDRPPVIAKPPESRPLVLETPPAAPLVLEPPDGSMLAALGTVEHDDQNPLRRVGAAVVLLMLTLLAAGAVGFGIYRGVSGLK